MSEISIEYLAGFFDGEGNVGRYRKKDKTWRYNKIRIANTHEDILKFIQKTFGGYIYSKKVYKKNDKPCWDWQLFSRNALPLVKELYPLCVVKKQALKKYMEYYNYE